MNHFAPIPCAHCGTNFMRRDTNPDAPKLCNSCVIKDQTRNPKEEVRMNKVQLFVECDRETQIEIEEMCTNLGISISNYLINLHKTNISNRYLYTGREIVDQEMQKMHEEFESVAHEPDTRNAPETKRKSKGAKK